jgi:hypothetical protein
VQDHLERERLRKGLYDEDLAVRHPVELLRDQLFREACV